MSLLYKQLFLWTRNRDFPDTLQRDTIVQNKVVSAAAEYTQISACDWAVLSSLRWAIIAAFNNKTAILIFFLQRIITTTGNSLQQKQKGYKTKLLAQ